LQGRVDVHLSRHKEGRLNDRRSRLIVVLEGVGRQTCRFGEELGRSQAETRSRRVWSNRKERIDDKLAVVAEFEGRGFVALRSGKRQSKRLRAREIIVISRTSERET
jgi:hypothetical protein